MSKLEKGGMDVCHVVAMLYTHSIALSRKTAANENAECSWSNPFFSNMHLIPLLV